MILWLCVMLGLAAPALAEPLRIATFHTELERDGPGLLLRDILKGDDAQLIAVRQVIAATSPDILVLQGVDYDHGLVTLTALRDWLAQDGPDYPHLFARAPNAGLDSGVDLDGDGRLGGPRDAQGYGRFFGQGAWRSCHVIRLPMRTCRILPSCFGAMCRVPYYRQ